MKEEPLKVAEKMDRGKIDWNSLPNTPPAEIKNITKKIADEHLRSARRAFQNVPRFHALESKELPTIAVYLTESKAKKIPPLLKTWCASPTVVGVAPWDFSKKSHDTWSGIDSGIAEKFKEHRSLPLCEGLSLPEQVVFAIQKGLPAVVMDGMRNIWKHQVHSKRAMIDQFFSMNLSSAFPVQILTHAGSFYYDERPQIKPSQHLAGLILFEQMAQRQGVDLKQLMFSSFPITDPEHADWIALLSLAQITREFFSKELLWYQIPDAHPLYFFIAQFSEMDVFSLTPPRDSEKVLAEWKKMNGISREFSLNVHGHIARQAHAILEHTWRLLKKIQQISLWDALDKSVLTADVGSESKGGEDGIFQKSYHYWNPVEQWLKSKQER